MAQMGMFTRAERLGFKVGDVVSPLQFGIVDDAYTISRRDQRIAWFVLYIDPTMRSASRVERFISRFGFESFWPRAKAIRRVSVRKNGIASNKHCHPTEKRIIETAVLPRYMLVALPENDPSFHLFDGQEARANGIVGFVAIDNSPRQLQGSVVAALKEREASGEWDDTVQKGRKRVAKQPEWCAAGRTVRITDGPFASFNAVVERLIGDGHVRTTLSIFGRQAVCELELGQVAPIS